MPWSKAARLMLSIRTEVVPASTAGTWKVPLESRFFSTHHPEPSYQRSAAMKRLRFMQT